MPGGARAQYHLRQCFFYLDVLQIIKSEVFAAYAARKFDENGRFLDEEARGYIGQLFASLVAQARRVKKDGTAPPGSADASRPPGSRPSGRC
jgi:chromate reductase